MSNVFLWHENKKKPQTQNDTPTYKFLFYRLLKVAQNFSSRSLTARKCFDLFLARAKIRRVF